MRPWSGWCAFGAACLVALHASLAAADPEVGWWWNPNESGRGYFIESQGGIMYMAAYLYSDDGRARWLVSGGPNADPNHYRGRLLEYSGGQTLFGAYVPPSTPSDAGAVSVDFVDDRNSGVVSGTSPHSFVSGSVGPVSIGPDTEREGRYGPFFELQ